MFCLPCLCSFQDLNDEVSCCCISSLTEQGKKGQRRTRKKREACRTKIGRLLFCPSVYTCVCVCLCMSYTCGCLYVKRVYIHLDWHGGKLRRVLVLGRRRRLSRRSVVFDRGFPIFPCVLAHEEEEKEVYVHQGHLKFYRATP